jgi:hypothetical protein
MNHPLWRAVAALGREQRGYVDRVDLRRLGVSDSTVDWWIRSGLLIPVYRGVYAVGHLPTAFEDRAMAAILAGRPGAALSHWSAAKLWDIVDHWSLPFHIVVRHDRRPKRIVVHRAPTLTAEDLTVQCDLPCASPARTLLDLAVELRAKGRLTRAVNNVQHDGWMKRPALIDVIERFPRHPGAKLLRPLAYDEDGITESQFEDLFRPFHAAYDLPPVRYSVWIAGKRADAFFPKERVIVECDSWEFHRLKTEFISDRQRDLDHKALGYLVVRITWTMLLDTPDHLARQLHAILARRRKEFAVK